MISRCAAVVPARNEEKTIGAVVRALKASPLIGEVVVVSDGSTDRTADEARAAGADTVISLPESIGKGGALARGVAATQADVLFFCDGDLLNFTPKNIEALLRPVLSGKRVMCTGLRDRGHILNAIEAHLPLIGGERALTRDIFEGVPDQYMRGFRVELSLNYYCRVNRLPYGGVVSRGVQHVRKMKKAGILPGLWSYVVMITELTHAILTLRSHRKEFLI